MAGVEQQDAGGDEFVLAEPALLALGDEELADQVVAEVDAARPRVAAHEVGELGRRRGGALLDRSCDAELVHRHHPMRPVEQLRPQGARDAEEVGDHGDGDRGCESLDQVRRAVGRDRVDPRVGERGDAGPKLLDLARDEGAIDEVSAAACARAAPSPGSSSARARRTARDGPLAAASRVRRGSSPAGSGDRGACRA